MSKNEEWVNRYLNREKEAESFLEHLKKKYGLTTEQVIAIIAYLWSKMGDNINYSVALSAGYLKARNRLFNLIDELFDDYLINNTTLYLKGIYVGSYKEALSRLPFDFKNKGLPFLNDDYVLDRINVRWAGDGKLYSDRIWQHKSKLKFAMDTILKESITSGRDIKKTSKDFAELMGSSYKNAERLVRTETNFVLNQSAMDVFVNTGVEKYEYIAKLDRRTSAICRATDGKIFLTSEAIVGVNYPPLHPNCRSTVAPVIEF